MYLEASPADQCHFDIYALSFIQLGLWRRSVMRRDIVRGFLAYTSASYAVQVIGVMTSIVIRHFMEPASMGLWSLLDVMTKYGLYANLGILTAMNVELPICIGRGELEKARKMRDTTLVFAVVASLCFGLAAAGLSPLFFREASSELRLYILLNCALLVVTTWYNFYVSLMWAEKKFVLLGAGIITNAVLYLLFVFLLVPRFKVAGLLTTAVCSLVSAATLMHIGLKSGLRFELDRKTLWSLLKAGFPLMLVGFSYSFFMTVDRFLITRYLGTIQLGYYSIAILMLNYAITIPTMVSNVLFPSLLERFGKTGSHKDISVYATKPVLLLSYVMPVILCIAYFNVPYLVKLFMTKYEPGVESMHIVLIGSFFISISQPAINYLFTISKRLQSIPLIFLGTVAAVASSALLVRSGQGLNGVALGMSLGYFTFYTALLFYAFGHFQSAAKTAVFFGETLLCFVYLLVVVWLVSSRVVFSGLLAGFLAQNAALLVLCMPYLFLVEKKTGALSALWNAIRTRRAAAREAVS